MTIKQRQHLLAYLGYYVGAIDGDWGSGSRAACTAFQKDREITADGIGGPETDKALKYAVGNDLMKTESTFDSDTTVEDFSDVEDWPEGIEYFGPPEFACKCNKYCNGFPHKIQPLLVQIADRARKHFGQPITIVSGLRCRQHNANVGGVSNSQHMFGEAADVYVRGVGQQTVLNWFLSQPDVRYAYAIEGSSNVHFDIQKVGR